MPFVQRLREEFSEKGAAALETRAEFDQTAVLNTNLPFITATLDVRTPFHEYLQLMSANISDWLTNKMGIARRSLKWAKKLLPWSFRLSAYSSLRV